MAELGTLIAVIALLGLFIGAVVLLMNWSGKAGQNKEIVDQQNGGCSWCADGRTHSSRRRAPVEDWGSMDDLLAASLKFLDEYKPGDPLKIVW